MKGKRSSLPERKGTGRNRSKPADRTSPGERRQGKLARQPRQQRYVLRLYVAGMRRTSSKALEQVRGICEEHLQGRYELEVIDIYQLPALAKGEQIVATPTLIRVIPAPLRRYIGDLSRENILFGLDLCEKR